MSFTECTVQTLSWRPSRMSIDYTIGSGSLTKSLSEIKQEPDCGKSFNTFRIASIESAELLTEQVLTTVMLDDTT